MKYLSTLPILALIFSSPIFANQEQKNIDIEFTDTELSVVVEMVNKMCPEQLDPNSVKNPDLKVTLNFKDIPCDAVVSILNDADSKNT